MSLLVTGSEMLFATYMQYNQHLKNHKVLKKETVTTPNAKAVGLLGGQTA